MKRLNKKLIFLFGLIILIVGVYNINIISNKKDEMNSVELINNTYKNSVNLVRNNEKTYKYELLSNSTDSYTAINGYRYVQEGFIADGGSQDFACGTAVWIDYCDANYCYYTLNGTRKVYRSKLASSYEGAKATCKNNVTSSINDTQVDYGDRYVTTSDLVLKKYSCGDELYITTCSTNSCNYSKVNGKKVYGVIEKKYLKNSKSLAKAECGLNDKGDRYVSIYGDNYSCGDKLYITTCVNGTCEYTKVNDKSVKANTISQNVLKNSQSAATSECKEVNSTRYVAGSGKNYSCSDELYITNCTSGICNYTKVNGVNAKGTISDSELRNSESAAEKDCNFKGPRYSVSSGNNYKCGDELYITTCDNKTCKYNKVNGSKVDVGEIDKSLLKESKDVAVSECVYGNRYVAGNGSNYSCGNKLYITSCDEGICEYTKVDDQVKSGTVDRSYLRMSEDEARKSCGSKVDFGNRYVVGSGSDYSCGAELYIISCENNSCIYSNVNGVSVEPNYVDRDNLRTSPTVAKGECESQNQSEEEAVEEIGAMYPIVNGMDYNCGDVLHITSCSLDVCNYSEVTNNFVETTHVNGTIDINLLVNSQLEAKTICEETQVSEKDKKCTNEKEEGTSGESARTFCYEEDTSVEEIKEEIEENYICPEGYSFDPTAVVAQGSEICNANEICSSTFAVNCTKGKEGAPTLSVSSGLVQSDGKGTINVTVSTNEGIVDSYYISEIYEKPTDTSVGWQELSNNSFTIESTPGIKYIWVRDSKGNISNGVGGAVIDGVTSDTTVKSIELYDENGKIVNSDAVSYDASTIKSNKYVMLSNELSKDSKVIADAFNPYDMEYKIEVSSPTVSVYATLTSTDSNYVPGYEPRTVNLEYGVNTILIKIQNKEGKIRTYTILATRTDDRTSDNTLSDLTVSEGKINFNANVTEYKVEIPKSTTSVTVNSTIASDKASYVEGYEPGTVQITGDTTVKLIKVISETGSTRTYVISFIKEGTDIISKESLQLSDLVIPGVYIAFEEDVANYNLSVEYEKEKIDLNAVLKDENSSMTIRSKRKSDNSYKETTNSGIALDVGENFIEIEIKDKDNETSYYRLTVIRKEFGLGISEDTTLKDLSVLGYDIDFNPKVKDYTVRIKQEKSLVITAVPNSNRAEVFIRGNDELTGFSTVRIKVIAENGKYDTYSIDIKKDAFNKVIEIGAVVVGAIILVGGTIIIVKRRKSKNNREYFEE